MHTYVKTADTILAIRDARASTVRRLPQFTQRGWTILPATRQLSRCRSLGVRVYTYMIGDGDKLVPLN